MSHNSIMLPETALSFSGVTDHQDASPCTKWQHPPSFYCPISQQVMHDPVVVSDGHTYERRHIMRWLQAHTTSPVSNEALPEKSIFPNHALRNAISEYFDQVFSVHRRAIRKSIRGQEEQQRFGTNEPLLHTIDALMQCSFLMNADLSTECVLRKIMNEAKNLLGAEAASVFLVDAVKQELYSKVNSTDGEIRIPITSGIAGFVASSGEALMIPDAYLDDRFNRSNDIKTGFRTHNILCVPLKLKKGTVIGVVQLINKTGAGAFPAIAEEGTPSSSNQSRAAFTAHDKQFLQVFASQAAAAVANSGGVSQGLEPQVEPTDVELPDSGASDLKKGSAQKDFAAGLTKFVQNVLSGPAEEDVAQPSRSSSKQSVLSEIEEEEDAPPRRCASKMSWADVADDEDTEDIAQPMRFSSNQSVLSAPEEDRPQPAHVAGKVASMLSDALHGFQLDALALAELTDNKPLSTLGMYLFEHSGLVKQFCLDTKKLHSFFVEIEKGYDAATPYHNRAHAASVMHAMYALLEHGGVADAIAPAFASTFRCGPLQRLACLLAAAVHDHEHLGLTNEFLVRTRHERATLYNDQHVNEHHHAASAFSVLQRPECNFLDNLPDEDFRQLRSVVIDLVLGTDMAKGGDIHKAFSATFGAPAEGSAPAQSTAASTQDAVLLLQMAMKCADLGHMALSWEVHKKWVARVESEFFAQGDKEKAACLPVSFLMDRNQPGCSATQPGFFDFVVFPLFRSMVHVLPLAQPLLDGAQANYCKWKELDGATNTSVSEATKSDGSGEVTATTSGASSKASNATDNSDKARKKSGRTRQRAAKYWATVRCRTPSPEPGLSFQLGQKC